MFVRRLSTVRLLIFAVTLIVFFSAAGAIYAGWSQTLESADGEGDRGAVPVSDTNWRRELAAAGDRVGFEPLVPAALPTEADKLVLVDASEGPPGASKGLKLIELVYEGAQPREIDGVELNSTLEMFQTNLRLDNANGERIASNVAGYELHRDVVSSDAEGNPAKVTYTARSDSRTFVLDFTGDQPTMAALEQMLRSLQPLRP